MHVLSELDIAIDRSTANEAINVVMRRTLAESTPMPGAVDAVIELAARDIRLGVVSSAVYHPFLEWSLEKFGIIDRFESVITSASSGYYKSRTEIYVHSLDALGASARETVHIGDSYRYDVQTARRVGMGTVWYRQPEHDHAGCGSDAGT